MFLFQTAIRLYYGLGNVYGQIHLFIEEWENPEETSEEVEEGKETHLSQYSNLYTSGEGWSRVLQVQIRGVPSGLL